MTDTDPPQLTFSLRIHNMGPVGGSGTNLFQVAIRDSISGIVPLRSEGRVVERGYQMFSIDSLSGKDWKCLRAESKNCLMEVFSMITFEKKIKPFHLFSWIQYYC